MKLFQTALKFAPLMARKAPIFSPMKAKLLLPALGIAAYGLWTGMSKVLSDEMITVETEDSMKEGEIRELQVGPKLEDTVMLIMYEGEVYCTQSKCSHFGFSLAKGLLFGDKVICPLHNAGFSIKTGQPEQGPVFDGLQTFPVERKNGKIVVSVPKVGWEKRPVRKELGEENIDKSKKIVIIGAGTSAQAAVDTLRESGYNGLIYMISKEQCKDGFKT
jgi:nitrite reductase/ring-hydroxylating ferredoxin subunit